MAKATTRLHIDEGLLQEPRPVRLPTHGSGGMLAGVDLEDKVLIDRLLNLVA